MVAQVNDVLIFSVTLHLLEALSLDVVDITLCSESGRFCVIPAEAGSWSRAGGGIQAS